MSCNSAIHTRNSTNATVSTTAGTFVQIPFGSVIRRFGRNLGLDGGSIICCGSGYFDINCSCSLTTTAAGPITVQIRQDNNVIATAITTGAAAAPITLPLTGLIRNCGCDCNSTLTLWVNAPCTATNISTVVEKL